jgi:hypothetical protein
MKVTQEVVTVLADPSVGEVNLVLPGLRITLSAEEATQLVSALASGLDRLARAVTAEALAAPRAAPTTAAPPSDAASPSPLAAEADAIQHRTRALIQATIREKGLSLREEERL